MIKKHHFLLALVFVMIVLNVSAVLGSGIPERCAGPRDFDCLDKADLNGINKTITIVLKNNLGYEVALAWENKQLKSNGDCNNLEFVEAAILGDDYWENKEKTLQRVSPSNPFTVKKGEKVLLKFYCENQWEEGRFMAELNFPYINEDSGAENTTKITIVGYSSEGTYNYESNYQILVLIFIDVIVLLIWLALVITEYFIRKKISVVSLSIFFLALFIFITILSLGLSFGTNLWIILLPIMIIFPLFSLFNYNLPFAIFGIGVLIISIAYAILLSYIILFILKKIFKNANIDTRLFPKKKQKNA